MASLIEGEFDTALTAMLETLRHVGQQPGLDYEQLRSQTFLRAQELIPMLAGACEMVKWYAMIGSGAAEAVIRERLDKLPSTLKYRMRQFEVGFDRIGVSGAAGVTNNIVNAHIISGVVQQAGAGSMLHAEADLDLNAIGTAAGALEAEVAQAPAPPSREIQQINVELATIRAQLGAPEPRASAIREAAKSIRHIAEQAAGGALSPSIISAAVALGGLIR
jgi:hypothetical protein